MAEGLSETSQESQISNFSENESVTPTFDAIVYNGRSYTYPEETLTTPHLRSFRNFLAEKSVDAIQNWSPLGYSLNIFDCETNQIVLKIDTEEWTDIQQITNLRNESLAKRLSSCFINLSFSLLTNENPYWKKFEFFLENMSFHYDNHDAKKLNSQLYRRMEYENFSKTLSDSLK